MHRVETLTGRFNREQAKQKVLHTFMRLLLNAKTSIFIKACFIGFLNAIEKMNRKKIKAIEFFEVFISC